MRHPLGASTEKVETSGNAGRFVGHAAHFRGFDGHCAAGDWSMH